MTRSHRTASRTSTAVTSSVGKKNSSLVIERTLQSLTPGVISVCFLPGSEDRTPGGSVVTNLDNLKSSFTPVAAEVGRNLVNSAQSKIVS